jgi:hypothetical protein
MTLPVYPNSINLSNIQTEFGGSNPISLSEYYAGGSYVASGAKGYPGGTATNIPSSGAISFDNFHGATKTYNLVIGGNTANYNLRNALISAGYSGSGAFWANVTINSGVYVYSNSTGTAAFDTGTLSGGFIYITNNGYIVGKGGTGGTGAPGGGGNRGTVGAAGGLAFLAQASLNFTNNGVIGGGGGGGGGGAAGDGDPSFGSYGGGGGGGAGLGSGGPVNLDGFVNNYGQVSNSQPGGDGGLSTAGGGGSGGNSAGYGNDRWGWSGGSGGGLGSAGGNGAGLGTSGGAAGAAINGNSYITWITTGTRYGSIS